jgi:predicted nucleic acid-binding protein
LVHGLATTLLQAQGQCGVGCAPERAPRFIFANIGAHFDAHPTLLVTNNTKEFRRVAGLRIVDWTKASTT